MDKETLKSLPREEQNKFIQQYLAGGPRFKDFSQDPVFIDNDDGTLKDLSTGKIIRADKLDPNCITFE